MASISGALKRFVARVVEPIIVLGTGDGCSGAELKRVRLTNGLALTAFALMTLWLLGDLITFEAQAVTVSAISWVITALPLVLSFYGVPTLARPAFLLAVNAQIAAGALLFPRSAGGALVLIPMAGMPIMLYDAARNRKALVGFTLLPVALFALSEGRDVLDAQFSQLPAPTWAFPGNAAAAFIGLVLVVSHFHRENRRAEDALARSLEDLRTSQAKLVESSKMSALGQMASAIAHEVKSPLVVICGNASLLHKALAGHGRGVPADAERLGELAKRIEATGFRIGRIVTSLQAFARDGSQDPMGEVGVANVVTETLDLCRNRFVHSSIRLDAPTIPSTTTVWGRGGQVSQVLLNLLNNACDAVADLPEERRWVRIEVRAASADAVEIAVFDGGPGVPSALRERIMEAFFTTKPPGLGTGLGLSISRSIVAQSGGTLRLADAGEKADGETCFVIRWPRHEQSADAAPPLRLMSE